MSGIAPAARPEMTRAAALSYLQAHGIGDQFGLIGRRGYYRDSMGKPGVNDRGIYDDAIALLTPSAFVTFNANCDPSRTEEGMASLVPGVWEFEIGVHNRTKPANRRYKALIQAAQFVVFRDGTEHFEKGTTHQKYGRCLGGGCWVGWFGVNMHRGLLNSTASAACQTIVPDQWDAFIELVESEMKRYGRKRIPYVLTERDEA